MFVLMQMVFKKVFKGNYFGGRCLIAESNMKNVKRQIARERGILAHERLTNKVISETLAGHVKPHLDSAKGRRNSTALG